MSNVFGPVNKVDWKDMSRFFNLAKFLSDKDPYRHADGIDVLTKAYQDIKTQYAISN